MVDKEEKEILETLSSEFRIKGKVQRKQRIWISLLEEDIVEVSKRLKEMGFEHLSAISATDWLDEKKYELAYHFWSYQEKTLVTLKKRINRKNPIIDSLVPLWGKNAQAHEREIHELFGVKFEGNSNLKSLFLEDWEGPEPFRKDFDWREYVREEFYEEEDEREEVYFE